MNFRFLLTLIQPFWLLFSFALHQLLHFPSRRGVKKKQKKTPNQHFMSFRQVSLTSLISVSLPVEEFKYLWLRTFGYFDAVIDT